MFVSEKIRPRPLIHMPEQKVFYQRLLPHWHPANTHLFVTFSLFGSLPRMKRPTESPGKAFLEADRHLDSANTGPSWLKDPQVAAEVVQIIHRAESEHNLCKIQAYVVMSNHVHILLKPISRSPQIMKWIKGASARRANEILARPGNPFWQHESYDRWVRNSTERTRIIQYIEWNPVKAGLVRSPDLWPWSSANPLWNKL